MNINAKMNPERGFVHALFLRRKMASEKTNPERDYGREALVFSNPERDCEDDTDPSHR